MSTEHSPLDSEGDAPPPPPRLQPVETAPDPWMGAVLKGRYQVDEFARSGAVGPAYRGRDIEAGRAVVLRFVDGALLADKTLAERVERECAALQALRHRNVVSVLDHDRVHDQDRDGDGDGDGGDLFVVTEVVEGATLRDIITLAAQADVPTTEIDPARLRSVIGGSSLPEDSVLRLMVRWIADVAAGLAAAHGRGVFHRDINPSSVWINRSGRAVVADFGLALHTGAGPAATSEPTLGLPCYVAPEQAAGEARSTATLDVYGLSATLYHLVAGKPPVAGDPRTVAERVHASDPEPLHKINASIPDDLRGIVEKGLECDPADRYQTTAELESDLRAFLAHRPVSAHARTDLEVWWRRSRRRVITAAVLVVVALVALIGTVWWQSSAATELASERRKLWRQVPALIAIEGRPDERLLNDAGERDEQIKTLTSILELAPNDVHALLLRGSLYLDGGDHEAAAADIERIAAERGGRYLDKIAERYRDADRTKKGIRAVNLGGVPLLHLPLDHFVAGFHALRNRRGRGYLARADARLSEAMKVIEPAAGLRLVALLDAAEIAEPQGRRGAYQKAYDAAVALEQRRGYATARTSAVRGGALLGLGRNEACIESLEQSDGMQGNQHIALRGLGIAHWRLGNLERADGYLARAHDARPHFWRTTQTLALVLMQKEEYERAYRIAERLPEAGWPQATWKRPDLLAEICVWRLCHLVRQEARDDRMKHWADRAQTHLAAAARHAPPAWRPRVNVRRRLVEALVQKDMDRACSLLLSHMRRDPQNAVLLTDLATLLPDGELSAQVGRSLRAFVARLASSLSTDGSRLRQELDEIGRKNK